MVRRGPLGPAHHPMDSLPPPVLLENKLASQEVELEELARDNRTLVSSDFNLRQDLVDAHQKIDERREHIRSIQTEADIQIRIFSNKIAKAEADIRAGDIIKKELQVAHIEAQRLVTAKLQLAARIEQATKELDNSRAEVNKLPEMHAELDGLRQEHERLRETFKHEKGLNKEKVEQMKILEKNLIGVAGEVERLRAELLNAEKRASVGQGPLEGMNPFVSSGFAVGPPVICDPAISAGAGGVAGGAPLIHEPAVSSSAGGLVVGAPVISAPVVSAGVGYGFAVGAPMISGPIGAGDGGGVAVGAPVISDLAVTAGAGSSLVGNTAVRGVYDSSHTQM